MILRPTIGCFPSSISRQFVLKSLSLRAHIRVIWVVVSNIFYFPYLGKWSNLTCAYFSDGLVKKHQLESHLHQLCPPPFFLTNKNLEIRWKISHGTVFFFTTFTTSKRPSDGTGIFTVPTFFGLKFMANMGCKYSSHMEHLEKIVFVFFCKKWWGKDWDPMASRTSSSLPRRWAVRNRTDGSIDGGERDWSWRR